MEEEPKFAFKISRGASRSKFPYVVQCLDETWQTQHFASEAFDTQEQAIARARFLVDHGHNVVVLREIAYCERADR